MFEDLNCDTYIMGLLKPPRREVHLSGCRGNAIRRRFIEYVPVSPTTIFFPSLEKGLYVFCSIPDYNL
jgi:hypothetical protein